MDTRMKWGRHFDPRRFLEADEGTSTVEYAVLLGLIAVTIIPVVQGLGQKISEVNQSISKGLGGEGDSGSQEGPLPPGNPINSAGKESGSGAWAEASQPAPDQ